MLAEARFDGLQGVVVLPLRRRSRKELAGAPRSGGRTGRVVATAMRADGRDLGGDDGRRTTHGDAVCSRDQPAVRLACRRCGQIDIALDRLRPPLLNGHPTVYVGKNGEVRPRPVPPRARLVR